MILLNNVVLDFAHTPAAYNPDNKSQSSKEQTQGQVPRQQKARYFCLSECVTSTQELAKSLGRK